MIPKVTAKVIIPNNDNSHMTGDWVSKMLFNGWQPRLDRIKISCNKHGYKNSVCENCGNVENKCKVHFFYEKECNDCPKILTR